MGEVRRNDSITAHSLVKNGAHAPIRQVQADSDADQETQVVRGQHAGPGRGGAADDAPGRSPAETVALLWDCVLQVVPGDRRAGMVLDARRRRRPGPDQPADPR